MAAAIAAAMAVGGGQLGSSITLKLEYNDGEIRRVSFPIMSSPSLSAYQSVYAALIAHLQKKLGQHQAFSMGYFDVDDDFVSISDANDLAEAIAQVKPSQPAAAALVQIPSLGGAAAVVPLAGAIDGEGKRGGGHGNESSGVLKIKVLVHQYEILKIVEDGVVAAPTPSVAAAAVPPPSAAAVGRLPLPPATPPPRSPVLSPAAVAAAPVGAAAGGAINYAAVGVPSPQHHIIASHDEELRWLRSRVADLTDQLQRVQTLVQTLLPPEGVPAPGGPNSAHAPPS